MPRRLASGAYRSRVSRAKSVEQGVLLSACQRRVRRREASRISTMRRSAAMASSILRCISFCEPVSAAASLACRATTPSRSRARVPCTRRATSAPKAVATGSLRSAGAGTVRSVGKAASKAAARVAASVCRPARIRATPAPCEASGSPVRACWPSKRGTDQATAWSISARPSASSPAPASCRQEASKGEGASGTGGADIAGVLRLR